MAARASMPATASRRSSESTSRSSMPASTGSRPLSATRFRSTEGHRHRRFRSPCLRERAALPLQARPERERFSDPDASWGHRSAISTRKGGGFYGYKLHAAMCARTDLPVAWTVKTARTHESSVVSDLLTALKTRGFAPETAALDKGYDVKPVYDACHEAGSLPIIPLRQTPRSSAVPSSPRSASMAPGRSLEQTSSATERNGAARPADAHPRASGERPAGSTRSSHVRQAVGVPSTVPAPQSNENSAG